jgi:hypothetical protein
MREIAEVRLVGDPTDRPLRDQWIAQHTMRARGARLAGTARM